MRSIFFLLFSFTLTCFLSACGGTLYERETDLPEYLSKTNSISIGETRQKVRSVLGEPLLDLKTLKLEVYRKSGRDIAVLWVFLPWVPVPTWGDKDVAVVLVLYDEQGKIREVSSQLWEGERFGFEAASVDAGGFSFVNISHKPPATLLSPPITSQDLVNIENNHKLCSLIFVMDRCPMQTIFLDGYEIADFPNVGAYCDVYGGFHDRFNQILFDALLWIQIEPGGHGINIRQRKTSVGDFEKSFECRPGEIVFTKLRGTQFVPDAWYVRRLEGSIHTTNDITDILSGLEGARFILWHEGSWYGLPNVK